MKQVFDVTTLQWSLRGWHPHQWRALTSTELGSLLQPVLGPVPIKVPGSVQQALRDAGLLPDWTVSLNSLQCEWVENRHWSLHARLPAAWTQTAGRKILHCDGLDYRGVVLVNSTVAGEFANGFVPHAFDLTEHLQPGENDLTIVFTELPRALGQVGYTSGIRDWKVRFNYGWDWVPRLVQVGVTEAIRLEVVQGDALQDLRLYTQYDARAGTGWVVAHTNTFCGTARRVRITISKEGQEICSDVQVLAKDVALRVGPLPVQSWHCHGNGQQPLYDVAVELLEDDNATVDRIERRVGFRQIQWRPCAGAPADAEPWICAINGRDTFLQGVNWVPLRPMFADVSVAEYRQRLEMYRDLGVNLLRVWGGAALEREEFFRLCDELGILVWQEFPFSSSGLDNWPPEDPKVISEAQVIAQSYIARREHHPSLLLWCGGNELQGGLDGSSTGAGKPIGRSHPMMVALGSQVREMDPERRFLPTSSSGPRFMADAKDFGKGLHHDVHGPWNHVGALESWREYWDHDDALFRSEIGFPGASSVQIIQECGGTNCLPANLTHPFWRHVASWWIQWPDYLREGGHPDDLDAYVAWSQRRQADALSYAAAICKRRFPACGGIILWMGHDSFPCPINTAILDVDGQPKPAAEALALVFQQK